MSNMILDAFYSLGKNINKARGKGTDENEQGVIGDKYPELKLDMDNDKLGNLVVKWESKWKKSEVFSTWEKNSGENERYWLGQHFQKAAADNTRPMVDNAIFEALETYLPMTISQDPEAEVDLDNDKDNEDPKKVDFADSVQAKLSKVTGKIKLVNKLRKGARHWAVYITAVAKISWDIDQDIPTVKLVRMSKMILDDEATVDDDGYTGEYIGEYRKMQAGKMINVIKANGGEDGAVKIIEDLVGTDLGTEVGFIEWWTDEYMCWTIGKKVLLKKKNMHWNYEKPIIKQAQATEIPPEQQEAVQDPNAPQEAPVMPQMTPEALNAQAQAGSMGENPEEDPYAEKSENTPIEEDEQDQEEEIEWSSNAGLNHLKAPKKPYILLSFFNLGKQPIDDTSLIGQNLAQQDMLNKRNKQTDKNIDSMNNGMVVSLERSGLTQSEASNVTEALRKGGTVTIPQGAVGDAMSRMSANPLPTDVYNSIVDTRNRIKDIFGTRGSSASGLQSDNTVRGKYLNKSLDSSRTGGGISEAIEQWAENICNYLVQMLFVYDDTFADGQPKPPIVVSIKPGSTLPKDKTTIANQAISLAEAGKMSTLDLFKRLDMPNAEELAANVWLEANAPEVLFADDPRVAQVVQQRQQAQQAAAQAAAQQGQTEAAKPPSMSMNFKDLPPEGQAQMAAKAGIDLHPEAIAAHQELKSATPVALPDTKNTPVINNNQ